MDPWKSDWCPLVLAIVLTFWAVSPSLGDEGREADAMDPAIQPDYRPYRWPDMLPANSPHRRSQTISGITFTGRYANYTGADTFYLTWAPDGHLYSP